MIAGLVALALAIGVPCEDVYDRTAQCESPELEGLDVRVDPPAEPDAEFNSDDFGWRLLAASGLASVFGGAATVGVFAYDTHLAALRNAGTATPTAVDDALFQRSVASWAAFGGFFTAGLLLASSGAFLIFDPQKGRPRDAFRIVGD